MLHLRCAEPNLPEVTVVLCNAGSLLVWSSDGFSAGPPFFNEDRAPALDIPMRIIRRFANAS
jgi:hypothetical protein